MLPLKSAEILSQSVRRSLIVGKQNTFLAINATERFDILCGSVPTFNWSMQILCPECPVYCKDLCKGLPE